MSRLSTLLLSSSLFIVALVFHAQAQDPGGGPGGPGGGPGGPGGGRGGPGGGGPGGGGFGRGGFGGGFGGRGFNMSSLQLVSYPAVQDDLKLTDDQKEKITKLTEQVDQRRRALMPAGFGGRGGRGQQGQAQGQDAANAQPKQTPPQNPEARKAAFEDMRAKMEDLTAKSEKALAQILNKTQRTRLSQIALRREGLLNAIRRPEIQTKLNMSEDQIAQVQGVQDQANQQRREIFQARNEIFAPLRQQNDAGGGGGQGGGGQGGGRRGGGGQGGGGRGGFNREAFQALMDDPEVKSQLAKMDTQAKSLEDQTMLNVGKILTKRQKNTWNTLIGKAFDVDQLKRPPRGPGGDAAKGATANAATGTAKAGTAAATPAKKKSQRRRLPGDPEEEDGSE